MQPTIATNLDTTVSSRASQSSLDTVDANVDAILLDTAAIQPLVTANLDATVSSRATPAQVEAEIADDTRLVLLEKILRNRIDLNPADGTFTVYDDDSSTPLITGTAYEEVGGVTAYDGTSPYHRRNRLA
jgi:hypothetical protein